MRRPMTAGATPSNVAAAVRLPRCATVTKVSSCLSLAMLRGGNLLEWGAGNGCLAHALVGAPLEAHTNARFVGRTLLAHAADTARQTDVP